MQVASIFFKIIVGSIKADEKSCRKLVVKNYRSSLIEIRVENEVFNFCCVFCCCKLKKKFFLKPEKIKAKTNF
jgi:hypothetical protein